MSTRFQVSFDANDPARLAEFWAVALGYVEQPPPPGFDTWDAFADSVNMPAEDRDRVTALVDPDGEGPRLFFQKVPEGKTAKNRVHLDLMADDREAEVERLIGLGATRGGTFEEYGVKWTVLQDPEGNELCIGQRHD